MCTSFVVFTYGNPNIEHTVQWRIKIKKPAACQQGGEAAANLAKNPGAWFATVEGKFLLRGIADEPARFYNCLQALPKAMVIPFADLVEAQPLPKKLYTTLRARLTNIKRLGLLFNLHPLAASRSCQSFWQRCSDCVPEVRGTTTCSTIFTSTSCQGSCRSSSPRSKWRTSRH